MLITHSQLDMLIGDITVARERLSSVAALGGYVVDVRLDEALGEESGSLDLGRLPNTSAGLWAS